MNHNVHQIENMAAPPSGARAAGAWLRTPVWGRAGGGLLALLLATAHAAAATAPAPEAPAQEGAALTSAQAPVVRTRQGLVQGVLRQGVLEFRGIAYGQSVSGVQRWALAQPASAWEGVLHAQSFAPACAQAARYRLTEASDNEECLHLNISRPYLPGPELAQQKRPVLVWIHGGSFVGGSSSLYRLDRLAREMDAVIVSINYRLGVLGFLAHPGFDPAYNGGYALEDQRLALRWVRENIAAFGGDADNITLAGESAGGASVCMHLLAPEHTQGLFHKAIVQSAACTFGLRSVQEGAVFGAKVAQAAGCTDADPAAAAACLRRQPVQALIAAADQAAGDDLMAFAPVYGQRTLARPGLQGLPAGHFVRVPVLYGGTRDELRLWVGYAAQAGQPMTQANYPELLRAVYGEHAAAVQVRYPALAQGSAAATLGSVTSDFRPDNGINHCQFVDTAQLLARHVPVYFMEFADRQAPVLGVSMPAQPDPGFELGAVHSAELNYFFPHFSNTTRMDAPDLLPASQALSQQLVATWASFVRTGAPQALGLPAWQRFNEKSQALRFAPGQITPFDPGSAYQCDFWRSLYPAWFGA